MTTSQTTFLSKPIGDDAIPETKLEYIREKLRSDLHDLVLEVFLQSGISQSSLAKRLKKDKGQVSRTLGSPGNWTFDTLADYLFAIDGKLLSPEAINGICLTNRNMRVEDIASELLSRRDNEAPFVFVTVATSFPEESDNGPSLMSTSKLTPANYVYGDA